jgi:CheY-like chemotaxis protein
MHVPFHRSEPYILLVDDDPEDCDIIQIAFRRSRFPYSVKTLHNGEECMHYLWSLKDHEHPALILLDLNMPKINGHETLAEIRKNKATQHIPIIMLTTSSSDRDIVSSYQLGANSYITKPATMEALIRMGESFYDYWFNLAMLPQKETS